MTRLSSLEVLCLILCHLFMPCTEARNVWQRHDLDDVPCPSFPGELECNPSVMEPSAVTPDDINRVKYADIVSIAALGDSITTGQLSKNWPNQAQIPFFGNSFVTGGDGTLEEHTTLAKILRRFNPRLKGISYTEGVFTTGFNTAVGGQYSYELMAQARDLVERMRQQNATSEWKIVTIFIGANDLGNLGCFGDGGLPPTSPHDYRRSLEETLMILRDNLPNTFVMPITYWPPQLTSEMEWIVAHRNRDCDDNTKKRIARDTLINDYQNVTAELERDARFQTDKFTVVTQPFFEYVRDVYRDHTGQFYRGFYAEDSFHLSKWGNGVFAKYLWNGMLEKVGQKSKPNNLSDTSSKLNCPDEDFPFIRTVQNSNE